MSKNGFTLIELLGVIIIIAILMTIVFPTVINIVKNSNDDINNVTEKMVFNAVDSYIKNNGNFVTSNNDINYCMRISDLIDENYLKEPIKYENVDNITNTKSVKIIKSETYNYEIVDNIECDEYLYTNQDISSVGNEVYFDVVSGNSCKQETYENSFDTTLNDYLNSSTGYNGINGVGKQNSCLKFYVLSKMNDTVDLILDHNTTDYSYWTNSSSTNNTNGPIEVLNVLKQDTLSWKGTLNFEVVSVINSSVPYVLNYNNEYKARLITANEIVNITGYNIFNNFSYLEDQYYYFSDYTKTSTGNETCASANNCIYGFLYDRTSLSCKTYGCLNNSNINTNGYWTSTYVADNSSSAWAVSSDGSMNIGSINSNSFSGVRPVIRVYMGNL